MTGYQEIITDPSYKKQIITFTHPHIGNTGINSEDHESNIIHSSGIVINQYCKQPSNWRSTKTLEQFLIENEVIGISEIDTREITTILREKGAMNCYCIGALSKISEHDAIKWQRIFWTRGHGFSKRCFIPIQLFLESRCLAKKFCFRNFISSYCL